MICLFKVKSKFHCIVSFQQISLYSRIMCKRCLYGCSILLHFYPKKSRYILLYFYPKKTRCILLYFYPKKKRYILLYFYPPKTDIYYRTFTQKKKNIYYGTTLTLGVILQYPYRKRISNRKNLTLMVLISHIIVLLPPFSTVPKCGYIFINFGYYCSQISIIYKTIYSYFM